jgi:hypothetical protein
MQQPDLNRLQKTDLNNCLQETEPQQLPARKTDLNNCPRETELNVCPRERASSLQENSSVLQLNSPVIKRRVPQLPGKQGESRDVTFPRHSH